MAYVHIISSVCMRVSVVSQGEICIRWNFHGLVCFSVVFGVTDHLIFVLDKVYDIVV